MTVRGRTEIGQRSWNRVRPDRPARSGETAETGNTPSGDHRSRPLTTYWPANQGLTCRFEAPAGQQLIACTLPRPDLSYPDAAPPERPILPWTARIIVANGRLAKGPYLGRLAQSHREEAPSRSMRIPETRPGPAFSPFSRLFPRLRPP